MKKRLNEQLSVRSVLLILMSAVLVILISAIIAKATCTPASAVGCDVNCTVQIINNCQYAGFDRVARTCETTDCNICPGGQCGNRGCDGRTVDRPCAACVDHSLGGCSGLPECCNHP